MMDSSDLPCPQGLVVRMCGPRGKFHATKISISASFQVHKERIEAHRENRGAVLVRLPSRRPIPATIQHRMEEMRHGGRCFTFSTLLTVIPRDVLNCFLIADHGGAVRDARKCRQGFRAHAVHGLHL